MSDKKNDDDIAPDCDRVISKEEFDALPQEEQSKLITAVCTHACSHAILTLPDTWKAALIVSPQGSTNQEFTIVGSIDETRLEEIMMHYLTTRKVVVN